MTRNIVQNILRLIGILSLAFLLLPTVAAMGFEPMTAAIRVSSGKLYDYVVIGENPKASDGYDNAYDTISPGNLNASMGEPFINAIVVHNDWKLAMRELRGDIRSPAKKQVWEVSVTSSLHKGTPLLVAIQSDRTHLPQVMKLTLKDNGKDLDMKTGGYTLIAPGPGTTSRLLIIAEQP